MQYLLGQPNRHSSPASVPDCSKLGGLRCRAPVEVQVSDHLQRPPWTPKRPAFAPSPVPLAQRICIQGFIWSCESELLALGITPPHHPSTCPNMDTGSSPMTSPANVTRTNNTKIQLRSATKHGRGVRIASDCLLAFRKCGEMRRDVDALPGCQRTVAFPKTLDGF